MKVQRLTKLLLRGHVVVAGGGKAFNEDGLLDVVGSTQILQRFTMVADRGVDDAHE